jgi:hypothetical protein
LGFSCGKLYLKHAKQGSVLYVERWVKVNVCFSFDS